MNDLQFYPNSSNIPRLVAVRQLERARDSYNGNDGELGGGNNNHGAAGGAHHHEGEEDSSEETNSMNGGGGAYARRTKKMKTNGNY